MTKQEFLVISNLLAKHDFDELDRLEFVMCFERETKSIIPDEWLAEASLPKPEKSVEWDDSFRRDAAKDILAGMMAHPRVIYGESTAESLCRNAILFADELIKQLKEDKK